MGEMNVGSWDTAATVAMIAGVTLLYNVLTPLFSRGSKLSSRLASIEMTLLAVQAGITKLDDVLVKIADMRGEVRVLDARLLGAEKNITELRHGRGFVVQRSEGGLNGEY